MKKYLFLLLCFVLGCGGCGVQVPPPAPEPMTPDPGPGTKVTVVLHVDTGCPGPDIAAMYKAADIWRSQTGQLADIRFVRDLDYESVIGLYQHTYNGDNMLTCVTSDSDQVKTMDGGQEPGAFTLGWVLPARGIKAPGGGPVHVSMVSDRLRGERYRTAVYLHEFGHVLGLKHIDAFDTIMWHSTYDGKTTCLKKRDLEQFCDVHECGTTQTFPCE